MVKRSFYIIQMSPELSIWPNHIVCLQSSPFILILESTIFLSMRYVPYCSVCIISAQEVSTLSIPLPGLCWWHPRCLVRKGKMLPCDCNCGIRVQSSGCRQSCSGETEISTANPTVWMLLIIRIASALSRGMNREVAHRYFGSSTSSSP